MKNNSHSLFNILLVLYVLNKLLSLLFELFSSHFELFVSLLWHYLVEYMTILTWNLGLNRIYHLWKKIKNRNKTKNTLVNSFIILTRTNKKDCKTFLYKLLFFFSLMYLCNVCSVLNDNCTLNWLFLDSFCYCFTICFCILNLRQ